MSANRPMPNHSTATRFTERFMGGESSALLDLDQSFGIFPTVRCTYPDRRTTSGECGRLAVVEYREFIKHESYPRCAKCDTPEAREYAESTPGWKRLEVLA